MAKRLPFNRSGNGYRCRTATRTYLISRNEFGGWDLMIFKAKIVCDIRVDTLDKPVKTSWNQLKSLCVGVASEYEALGDDYKAHEHGYRERLTEAVQRAYAADHERMMASA